MPEVNNELPGRFICRKVEKILQLTIKEQAKLKRDN